MTLVTSPELHPSSSNTVAVANVDKATRTVSQPTRMRYETMLGSALPCTPNDARDSAIVGADPRFPASDTRPTRKNDTIVPTTAAISACQNDSPK